MSTNSSFLTQELEGVLDGIKASFKVLTSHLKRKELSWKCQHILDALSKSQAEPEVADAEISEFFRTSILPALTGLSEKMDDAINAVFRDSHKELNEIINAVDSKIGESTRIHALAPRGEDIQNRGRGTILMTASAQTLSKGGCAEQETFVPKLHALIIGIDEYASITKLRGAVADANDIEAYLKETVRAPLITKLLNQDATRKNILQEFRNLASESRKGEPILIFYAGHGAKVKQGKQSEVDVPQIEAIIPYDFDRKKIFPIPDTTLGALVARICEKVGNNITLIFDSCHSGSITRVAAGADDIYSPREVDLRNLYVPENIDEIMLAELSSGSDAKDLKYPDGSAPCFAAALKNSYAPQTHVLLAACSSFERAGESNQRGLFTSALLKLLKTTPYNQLTYFEVVPRLEVISGQHPQCEGENVHRYLFDGKALPVHKCYEVHIHEQEANASFFLDIGGISGIFQGATFDVYPNCASASNADPCDLLGVMIAGDPVGPWQTTLTFKNPESPFSLSPGAYAVQTTRGNITEPTGKLIVALDRGQHDGVSSAIAEWQNDLNELRFGMVTERSSACLEVTHCHPSNDKYLMMNVVDSRALDLDLPGTGHKVSASPEQVVSILREAAHFFYYLDLKPKAEWAHIEQDITIEIRKLSGDDWKGTLHPAGDNLYSPGSGLKVKALDKYGIKLTNGTTHKLYVYVFYFDLTDLAILKFYGRYAGHKSQDPSLLPVDAGPNNILLVGYTGQRGGYIDFVLPEGQAVDIGFIKFVFSTEPIDLEHVQRIGSAFTDRPDQRGARVRLPTTVKAWGIIQIPVKIEK